MQTQNKLLDDLARVASGAMGVAAGMREEVEARLRDQFERVLGRMDLVTREEQEKLEARVAALESALKSAPKTPKRAAKPKTGAKKSAPGST